MKNLILILILFSCGYANSQDIYALDKENGFRGMHFCDSISHYPLLKSFDQSPDSLFVFYKNLNENLIISGAKVEIVYTFYKCQLATVYIQTNDSMDSRNVLKYLQTSYGKGQQPDPYVEKHMWYGRDVLLSYFEDINTFHARIYISSIKMKLKSEGRDKY